MFYRKHILRNAAGDAPDAGGATPANPSPNPKPADAPNPAPVDVQAQIREALAAQEARFTEELKKTTGFSSFKEFNENRMKEQGKLQELADAREKEAKGWQTKFEQSQIRNALLSASAAAVDPTVITELLSSRAVCNADGQVSIAGKTVEEAVKQLLEDKPFLAKPQGGTGSGAPQQSTPAKTESKADSANLSPLQRLAASRAGK
jgi:ribonuclease D